MPNPEGGKRVLIVDDRLPMAEMLADGMNDLGYLSQAVASGSSALPLLSQPGAVDLLVTDLRMPKIDGLQLLEASLKSDPERPVIIMTAFAAIDSAVECIRRGAYHYLTKPFKLDELAIFVERALAERRLRQEASALRRALQDQCALGGLIGKSAAMQRVFSIVERVARTDTPVLLVGETGTGKGALARALHAESHRAAKPFIAINCAALPEALLESELFGHVKGAFTGAVSDKPGLFAEADGGTLLLDEIGEMTPGLQAKLLQVLESNAVRPVGAVKERPIDVRILAATHRDLRRRVAEGAFREDLLYRLDVVSIEVPPLRQRKEDISLFIERMLKDARARHPSSKVERFSRPAMAKLLDHRWPGNVRELSHLVERMVLLAQGPEVLESELPDSILHVVPPTSALFSGDVVALRDLQRQYARWAYEELGHHRARTAEKLDVDVKTLSRLLAEEDDASGKYES